MKANFFKADKPGFFITTEKSKFDIHGIHRYLSKESYWAKNIPLSIVEKSIEGSFCFGVFHQEKQVGFARVVTDYATFAYLADVFILPEYQGQGLAKWMMEVIMRNPALQGLRRWLLATRDAHSLYVKFGFAALDKPERVMWLKPFDEYPASNT